MKRIIGPRAYFKTLDVARQFRRNCEAAGHFGVEIGPRPNGWMVTWSGVKFDFALDWERYSLWRGPAHVGWIPR